MATIDGLTGSYSKIKNGYQIKYSLGWNQKEEKYETLYKNVNDIRDVFATLEKINSFINAGNSPWELRDFLDGKQPTQKQEISFSDFAEDFYRKQIIKKEVSDRTLTDYKCHIKRIIPYLGEMNLSEIKPADIDDMFSGLRSSDPRNNGSSPASGTYSAHIYSTLKLILDRAVMLELIDSNPIKSIDKPKRDTAEKKYLSKQEAQTLIYKITSTDLTAESIGLLICLCAGTRLSEMLALTWQDYKKGILYISKSMKKDSQEFKSTKTGENRIIPIPGILQDALNDWNKGQLEYYKEIGLRRYSNTPIVNSRNGKHKLQSAYERWYRQNKEEFGIPDDITIHGLRHTFITLTQTEASGDIATVSRMAGHSNIDMTNHYTHTNINAMQRIAQNLNSVLSNDFRTCTTCKNYSPCPLSSKKGYCWSNNKETDSSYSCTNWADSTKL